ncbi:MAG: hypothetical protein EBS38_00525 [Actinobacteria bacterium]|nr:hypothetical protein [Actinomycetota bacterium]
MFSVLESGDAIIRHTEIPMDPVLYGVIAMGVFIVLGLITWSYRNVANRHSHKATKSSHH